MRKQKIGIVVLLLISIYLLWENTTVGTTFYEVRNQQIAVGMDGITIAHVSDLHNSFLWKQVITLLHDAAPDLICITGDLVDGSRTDVDAALEFAAEAVKIAPCYFVTGNHELVISQQEFRNLLYGLESLGVRVLKNGTETVAIGDNRIAITGAFYGSSMYMTQCDPAANYNLLLAHVPEEFDSYASAGFDLVLTGHAHGGQFRLPVLGGLIAPGQGIFPEYDSGVFTSGNTKMVVSRGIGNSIIPVRVFNRPELIILELKAA